MNPLFIPLIVIGLVLATWAGLGMAMLRTPSLRDPVAPLVMGDLITLKNPNPYGASCYGAFFIHDPSDPQVAKSTHAECREVFGRRWKRIHDGGLRVRYVGFEFYKAAQMAPRLARLLAEAEQGLHLRQPSIIHLVADLPHFVVVEISPFWGATETTREVFTILLRAILVYAEDQDTIQRALRRYTLLRRTADGPLKAVLRFLSGRPHYLGVQRWVCAHFVDNFTPPFSRFLLVSPHPFSPLRPHILP